MGFNEDYDKARTKFSDDGDNSYNMGFDDGFTAAYKEKTMKLETDENTTIMTCIIAVLAVVAILIISIHRHSVIEDQLIAEAIKNGANPALVRCAFSDGLGKNPVCVLEAAK